MLGFGRDGRSFRRIKAAGGMRGWIECSDGRLYHPVVCGKATEAMKTRIKQVSRTEAARAARYAPTPEPQPPTPDVTVKAAADQTGPTDHRGETQNIPTDDRTMIDRSTAVKTAQVIAFPRVVVPVTEVVTGTKGKEQNCKEERLPLTGDGPPSLANAKSRLFGPGAFTLQTMTGIPEKQCKSMIGRWLKALGEDASLLNQVIEDCVNLRPAVPVEWIAGAVRHITKNKTAAVVDRAWGLQSFASAEALAAVNDA